MNGWSEDKKRVSFSLAVASSRLISLGNLPSSRFKVYLCRQLLRECRIQHYSVRIQAAGLANGGCVSQRTLEFSPSFSSWSIRRVLPAFRKEDKWTIQVKAPSMSPFS
jgi:hypothetical protein